MTGNTGNQCCFHSLIQMLNELLPTKVEKHIYWAKDRLLISEKLYPMRYIMQCISIFRKTVSIVVRIISNVMKTISNLIVTILLIIVRVFMRIIPGSVLRIKKRHNQSGCAALSLWFSKQLLRELLYTVLNVNLTSSS